MNEHYEQTVELKKAVLNNDIPKIGELIQNNDYLLTYTYSEEDKTILSIACSEDKVQAKTVRALLELNANPRDFAEIDGWEVLHWAASKTNYDKLNILLEKYPTIINVLDKYGKSLVY